MLGVGLREQTLVKQGEDGLLMNRGSKQSHGCQSVVLALDLGSFWIVKEEEHGPGA